MLLRSFKSSTTWSVFQFVVNGSKPKINKRPCSSGIPFEELTEQATVTENDTSQSNISNDSELWHLLGRSSEFDDQEQNKDTELSSIQTLRYTNKVLFGPLLGKSAQRKSWVKQEEQGNNEVKYKRKSVHLTNKENSEVKPLIYNFGNSHHLGIFPDSSKLSNERNISKVKIEFKTSKHAYNSDENSSTSKYNGFDSIIKRTAVTKIPQHLKSYNRTQGKSKSQKIIVNSWINDKEQTFGTFSRTTEILCNENEKKFNITENTLKKPTTNTIGKTQESNVKEERPDQKSFIAKLKEKNNNPYFIMIDNSKFAAVPSSLDLKRIENFPLVSDSSVTYAMQDMPVSDTPLGKESIVSIGIFDDGYHKLPSVRKILEQTMPQSNKIMLEKWKAKMIRELGEEGFQQYQKGLLDRGMLLHGCIQSELSGVTPLTEDMPSLGGLWTSLKQVLPNVSDVNVLESRLIHPHLHYQGSVDCVGFYRGTPMLIEWKTASKPKLSLKSMFDDPLQVVAYLGALNFDTNYKLPYNVDSALLVVAYDTGLPAHTHFLSKDQCEHYWKMWCSRLAQFWRQIELQGSNMKRREE
ncbi:mitochondrial genome maintenance exonuclease 1 [Procambarus clarkii]|uniref:mitochondrial genome maintenance exonuclease 1 n=1 Tax=Procambarus clarkii TaxID=6728 RepID=UPI003741F9EC